MQNSYDIWRVVCPHCKDNQLSINGVDEINMRIVCSNCKKTYLIDQSTNIVKINKLGKINYAFKLRCPHGCKHFMLYDAKANTNISIRCPICKRFFQGNLKSGETWIAKPIPCF